MKSSECVGRSRCFESVSEQRDGSESMLSYIAVEERGLSQDSGAVVDTNAPSI